MSYFLLLKVLWFLETTFLKWSFHLFDCEWFCFVWFCTFSFLCFRECISGVTLTYLNVNIFMLLWLMQYVCNVTKFGLHMETLEMKSYRVWSALNLIQGLHLITLLQHFINKMCILVNTVWNICNAFTKRAQQSGSTSTNSIHFLHMEMFFKDIFKWWQSIVYSLYFFFFLIV